MQQLTVSTSETFEYPKVNGNLGYFLIHLSQRGTNLYCICTQLGNSGLIKFTITENDAPTAEDGEVNIDTPGRWDMFIYEQASSSNLDPSASGDLLITDILEVTGDATSLTVFSGDCCTGGGGGDPVSIIDQDMNVVTTVACGGTYSVIVLSGIDGGAADTTYSNSVIAP